MEYLQIFSQRVYELRKKRGLSQKELGEAVGLSHKAIRARSTTIEKLIALADFFGVTMDYLIGREPPSGGPSCPIPTDRR